MTTTIIIFVVAWENTEMKIKQKSRASFIIKSRQFTANCVKSYQVIFISHAFSICGVSQSINKT